MKRSIVTFAVLLSALNAAAVELPAKKVLTLEAAKQVAAAAAVEAQAIRQKLGARVWIGTDQNGDMQYVLSFADWPA